MRNGPMKKSPTSTSAIQLPSALQVRCGKPSVMKSAVPRTTSSMPSVTRKDGIFSFVTNQPLTRPMKAATTSATTKPTSSEVTPALKSVHISTGEKPKTEPTERSNSPDVISSVMASAIRPSSTVKASVLLTFCGERKLGL